jgi:hypothetical protein
MGHTLVEGQIEEELDKTDQIAAAATSMAVEQILAGIDVKGRTGIAVQRTQPDKLLRDAGGASTPVVLLQVLQQRDALFEPFQIHTHGSFFSLPA